MLQYLSTEICWYMTICRHLDEDLIALERQEAADLRLCGLPGNVPGAMSPCGRPH